MNREKLLVQKKPFEAAPFVPFHHPEPREKWWTVIRFDGPATCATVLDFLPAEGTATRLARGLNWGIVQA